MTRTPLSLPQPRSFLQTSRKDLWWLFPAITFIYFSSFIVYSTWAALQGQHYFFAERGGAQYLSPMYSPVLWVDSTVQGAAPLHHAWIGEWPAWLPHSLFGFLAITPAVLILWAPGGFRLTCYYYRGAYYKAIWQDPPNCAVGEPRKSFWGEHWGPLVIMNIHRYFMYLAMVFIFILAYDAVLGFIFVRPDGSKTFGIGVGSLVLTANVVLLAGYTLGCHSLRHLVAGRFDCVSTHKPRYKAYQCVSCLNRGHMLWAWISLFWVGFTDVYIRLCSMGIWHDWRII